MQADLADLDDCVGLSQASSHPDFVANTAATADRGYVLVDWTAAGYGPRLWSLAFLLFIAGAGELRRVDAVAAEYRRHVRLEQEEMSRLDRVPRADEAAADGPSRETADVDERGVGRSDCTCWFLPGPTRRSEQCI